MAWTDKMVEELKKLWDMGITTGEIGKRLGISKNSIVGKVHRLGLEGRPSPIKKSSESSSQEKKAPKKATAPKKPVGEKKAKSTAKKENATTPAPITENKEPAKKEVSAPKKSIEKPIVKNEPTVAKPLVDEDDIKLIKSLDVKSEKDYQKENISLTELDNHTCRWPLGDPKDADFHFCGRKVKTGQTYCEEHSAVAYVKPTRR